MDDNQPQWSPVPLAICEACSLFWAVFIIGGAAYLISEGWHWTTMALAIFLLCCWTCKWCRYPGTDKNDK